MRLFALCAFLLLIASPLSAMTISTPPPMGTVGNVNWIHVPGLSNTGTYTVSWGPAMFYPEAYELEEAGDAAFSSPTLLYQGAAMSYTVSGRADGTYYYRVRGINITYSTAGPWLDDDHSHAVDSTLSTIPALPAGPASVTVPGTSTTGSIPVSWTTVLGATGYDIQESSCSAMPVSPNWSTPYAFIALNTMQNPYTFTGNHGRIYGFRIRTRVASGSYTLYSLWSYTSGGCTVSLATPGPIAGLAVPTSSSSGSVLLAWTSSTNASSYDLEEDTGPTFANPTTVYQGASTSFTVTGRAGGTYYYRVRGVNGGGAGTWTAGGNPCAVILQAVGLPSFVTVPSQSSTGSFTVAWGSASNASTYELEEDATALFSSPTTVYQGAGLSCALTGRTNGTYFYRVRGVNASYQGGWASGPNPCAVAVPGTLSVAAAFQNFPATVVPGNTGVPVLQFALSADAMETITVTALTVTETGTLGLPGAVTAARLYVDVNGDGFPDGSDTLLATVPSPSGSSVTFAGLSESFPPSTSALWLVVYDLSASSATGQTLVASVAQGSDIAVTGSLSGGPAVAGLPVSGATKTTGPLGSLSVIAGPGNPGGGSVLPGGTGVPVMELRLIASADEDVYVQSVVLSASGTGDDASGISGAFLYMDADGDDLFDPFSDTLLFGPATFSSDDGSVSIPLNHTIQAGSGRSYFVVFGFDAACPDGATFQAVLASQGDITATGCSTFLAVPVAGAPLSGGVFTISNPVPPPSSDSGRCGGGGSAGGSGPLSCWILLLASFFMAARYAKSAVSHL